VEMKLDVDLDIGNEMIYNNAIKDVLQIIDKYKEEQESCENKMIDKHYKKGFANGLRTADWRYDNAIREIREQSNRLKDSLYGDGLRHALEIINKYKAESEE